MSLASVGMTVQVTPGCFILDQQHGDAVFGFLALLGPGHDEYPVGDIGILHEQLRALDGVVVALVVGLHRNAGRVISAAGLIDRKGHDPLAVGDGRQEVLLLGVIAGIGDGHA